MSEIQIAELSADTIQMHWKCNSCAWSLNYFNEPKALQPHLTTAMQFSINNHKCNGENNA